jgi:hypothetical protein
VRRPWPARQPVLQGRDLRLGNFVLAQGDLIRWRTANVSASMRRSACERRASASRTGPNLRSHSGIDSVTPKRF